MKACIFCDIVAGTQPCHPIWEDDNYEGYLSSHDYKQADDQELAQLAKYLRDE